MKRRKVIIDCDPGIDDSLALMLTLNSPELEVLGITIVSGNVEVEKGYENAMRVLHQINRIDIPIYKGENKPIHRDLIPAYETHGKDGLGETHYPIEEVPQQESSGVDFILQTLQTTKDVSIIALGPLTNIAKALIKEQQAFENLEEFISMGGNFKSYGNCSPVAEYNYWVDPEAAKYVYENLGKTIHMVGLDVTRKIVLTPEIISLMDKYPTSNGRFIKDITKFYMDFHWEYEGIRGCVINDPLAIMYFIDPSICSGFEAYTTVATQGICRGQSVVDEKNFWRKTSNSKIMTKVDHRSFMKEFMIRVVQDDPEFIQKLEDLLKHDK